MEVLVALVVVSVGLLGLFALHARSMLDSRTTFQDTLATLHAQDAAEHFWLLPCFSIERAELALEAWRTRTEIQTALPDWQASHQWLSTANGYTRLVIQQAWAQRNGHLSLTFSIIDTPCAS